jgi:hypothetical protein
MMRRVLSFLLLITLFYEREMCCVELRRSGGGPFKLLKKRVKKKNSSFPSKTKQSSPLIKSSSLSLISSLSRGRNSYVRTTSRFCQQRVSSFDLQIYIHTTYTFVYHLSAEFSIRAHLSSVVVRAHKQTQKWPRRSAAAARR